MKLITQKIEKILSKLPLGSQDGKGKDATVAVKFFTPDGCLTWYVLEGERYSDGNWLLYGLVTTSHDKEYGYFNLNEIMSIRGHLGLPVERDMYFDPMPLGEALNRDGMSL